MEDEAFVFFKINKKEWEEATSKMIIQDLITEWREDMLFISSIDTIRKHPSYNRLLEIGEEVIPYCINQLRNKDYAIQHFIILAGITKENPVEYKNAGVIVKMAEDWIDWYDYVYAPLQR